MLNILFLLTISTYKFCNGDRNVENYQKMLSGLIISVYQCWKLNFDSTCHSRNMFSFVVLRFFSLCFTQLLLTEQEVCMGES